MGIDLENNPELAAFPSVAAKIAALYFTRLKNYDLNSLADGTFFSYSMMTYLINSGLDKMANRVSLLEKFMSNSNCGQLLKGKGEACSINGESGYCKPLCTTGLTGKNYCGCNGNSQTSSTCKNPLGGRAPFNVKCCVEKCANEMDLTFLLDSSGSIASTDFQKSLQFTKNIVDSLEIGENKTRVGIINFSSSVQLVTYLNSIYSKTQLISTINSIQKLDSSTYTGEALQKSIDIYKPVNGARNPSEG